MAAGVQREGGADALLQAVARVAFSTVIMREWRLFFSLSPSEKYARAGGGCSGRLVAKSAQPSNQSEPETQTTRENGLAW